MPLPNITTNFKFSDGVDVGERLMTKDYFLSAYPNLHPSLYYAESFACGSGGGSTRVFSNTFYKSPGSIFSQNGPFKQISCSRFYDGFTTFQFFFAIKSDGTLWSVGDNNYGQLGLNSNSSTVNTLTQVGTDTDWKYVCAGPLSTAAIKTDGTLYTCGRNTNRQLGLGDAVNKKTFQKVSSKTWSTVAVSKTAMCAIDTNGYLWSWGTNTNGILGIGDTNDFTIVSTPQIVNTIGFRFKSIDMNRDCAYAISTDGELYRWGFPTSQTSSFSTFYSPTKFGFDTDWKQVSLGYSHVAAIKTDGRLFSMGDNSRGNLGDNTNLNSPDSFVEISGGGIWKKVCAGNLFSVGIRIDGSLWTWGNNADNQLGNNSTTNRRFPDQTFVTYNDWTNVSCFNFGWVALRTMDI